jgi:parallel beta-helix repeat protein
MVSGTRRAAYLAAIALLLLVNLGVSRCGTVIHVRAGESIQDAVDAAQPGDTIVVGPGVYTATNTVAVVTVTTDDLTLVGHPQAVIDATGAQDGIAVGDRSVGCQVAALTGFTIEGFTFKHAARAGLYMANVDQYSATGGRYLDNEEYGPYPVCSTNGYVAFNFASGHNDAAIYLGQSSHGVIEFNRVVDSQIGIEVENASDVVVRKNTVRRNTAGIFVVALPGLDIPAAARVLITENIVQSNNRPNSATGGNLALLPTGSGILNVGGDDVVVSNNDIAGNDSFGIASVSNPFSVLDPRLKPFVDGLVVRENVILRNGRNPDPFRALTPGADIVFAADILFPPVFGLPPIPNPDPFTNCFANNVYRTEYVEAALFPGATLADFPCP